MTETIELAAAQRTKRTITAGTIGNIIEWYDFAVYGLFATVLAQNFFPSNDEVASLLAALAVFAVSFFVRPLGAIVFGAYGDRRGRKKALAMTVILMGLGTLMVGVLPTYGSIGVLAPVLLVVARLVQGLSTGGEWSGSSVFIVEHAPPGRRGLYGSWVQFGASGGSLLGSLVGVALGLIFSTADVQSWAWRLPFLFGGVLGAFGLFLRSRLDDTPEFRDLERRGQVVENGLGRAVTSRWRDGARAFGFTLAYTVSVYMLLTYMPTYVTTTTGIELTNALLSNSIQLAVMLLLIPFMGALSDRVGRRPVLLAFCGLSAVLTYPLFLLISVGTISAVIAGQVAFACIVALIGGAGPTATAEMFPTNVRFSALGISYNLAVAAFGGTAPFISTLLIKLTGDHATPALYMIAAAVVTGLVVLRLPETARRPLRQS